MPDQSEALLRQVLKQSPIGVAILEIATGRRMFVNDAFARMFGLDSGEDMAAYRIDETWVNPDEFTYGFSKIQNNQVLVNYKAERLRIDGTRWWALMNMQPMVFEGQEAGIVWHIDITDRIIAEKELQFQSNIVESMTDGVALNTLHDGLLVYANPKFEAMFGYEPGEMNGKSISILNYGSDDEKIDTVEMILSGIVDNREWNGEIHNVKKDGTEFWCKATIKKRNHPKYGSVAVSINTDITARKNSKSQLMKAKDEAEKASQVKSEFLASMSHELRTPMNAVLGFAQMLQFDPKNPLSPIQKEHVESILEGGKHLLELVNDVLDLSKIEADQLYLRLEDVDVNTVVSKCISLIEPLGELRNIEIIDQVSGGPDHSLLTDERRFRQVLLNLLSNAVNYNKDDGTVTVIAAQTKNDCVRISVVDTGIGISNDDSGSVFQMFHRIGADSMKARAGTGIGLTVTKLLVEKMAGRIGFQSEEGVGSTFWVELPLSSNKDVLIWTDKLAVGVDPIDKDHQHIVFLINRIWQLYEDTEAQEMIFNELIDYSFYHFKREELIMEVCEFPGLQAHKDNHRNHVSLINGQIRAWQKNRNQDEWQKLLRFMRNWWLDHILKEDSELVRYAIGKEANIRNILEHLK